MNAGGGGLVGGIWRVCGAVLGGVLGHAAWIAAVGSMPEADPERWITHGSSVPLEVAINAGTLANDPAALDLWSYRAVSPRVPAFHDGTVSIDAVLPPESQLMVRFGAEAKRTGPVPPARPILGAGAPQGARPRMSAGPPPPPEGGVLVVLDRSARDTVWGKGIVCDPVKPPAGNVRLSFVVTGDTLRISADGEPLTRCEGSWKGGDLVIGSGVRRVRIERVAVEHAGFEDTFSTGARSETARRIATAAGAVLGALMIARGALVVALLPLLALPWFDGVYMRQTLDALRLLKVPEAFGPLLFCGIPALAAALLVVSSRRTARGAAILGAVPAVVTTVLAAVKGWPPDAAGWVLLALAALPWTLLGWANTHAVGRRVLASYGLFGAVVLLAEIGVRQTSLDTNWTRTSGWRRASEEFAELLEIRRYRSYPLDGFPVKPPEPDPTKKRIAALGGSSTGGAFQMDDIALFWPKRLDELLPDEWEVVNQGVGGWNTLHVRLYLESQMERLDPDVLMLYVGHNDVLTPAPVPYRDLYARYRAGSSAVKAISGTLHNVRLYVGLKYALLALRDRSGAVAVPIPDARANLSAILDVAEGHGAKVVLVTEGINPDPLPLREYAAMQRALAQERGHYYFDAAEALYAEAEPTLFLDDCHLSESGHRRLAKLLREYLAEAGLVP